MQLEVDAEVSQPAGQRNFNGFDYQVYLKTQGIYRTVKISTINNILPIHSWNIFDWLSTYGGRLSFISNHIFLLP